MNSSRLNSAQVGLQTGKLHAHPRSRWRLYTEDPSHSNNPLKVLSTIPLCISPSQLGPYISISSQRQVHDGGRR
jgi:hypothetical protein